MYVYIILYMYTGWGPIVTITSSLAKLVQITIITMLWVYDTQIAIFTWGYKPTYNWGAPSCIPCFFLPWIGRWISTTTNYFSDILCYFWCEQQGTPVLICFNPCPLGRVPRSAALLEMVTAPCSGFQKKHEFLSEIHRNAISIHFHPSPCCNIMQC